WVTAYNTVLGCESARKPVNAYVTPVVSLSASSSVSQIVRTSGITQEDQLTGLNNSQLSTSVSYFDGMGRTIQQVGMKASPNGKDMIVPVEYDATGRTSKDYLPYTDTTTNGRFHSLYSTEQSAFYTAGSDKIANDAFPYQLSSYESSPLGRITDSG